MKFYENYDYYYIPFWQTRGFVLLFIAFVLLCVVVGGMWYYLRFRARDAVLKQLTPGQWALQKLSQLSPEQCASPEAFKKFYFDLTNIVKVYLHKRYGWPVLDKTDNELLEFVQKNQFDRALVKDLRTVFSGALYIKFAGQDALRTQAERDRDLMCALVMKTKGEDACE